MLKRVLPTAVTCAALLCLFAALADGASAQTRSRSNHHSLANGRAASGACTTNITAKQQVTSRSIRCAYVNIVPFIYVHGQQLTTADLSDHATVATFYGGGVVVRVRQQGAMVDISTVGLAKQTQIHVRIANG